MSKNRYAVTCNGRPAFYASMYEDIRETAMSLGWAVALHGSLKADMDIMAMPWNENAAKFETLVSAISGLFEDNELAGQYSVDYKSKPHGRVVATIPIWEDFYLDISTIDARKPIERIVERLEEENTLLKEQRKEAIEYDDEQIIFATNNQIRAFDYSLRVIREEGGLDDNT